MLGGFSLVCPDTFDDLLAEIAAFAEFSAWLWLVSCARERSVISSP